MSQAKEINVHIGQVRIGRNGDRLKALLGSCVAIGFIWRRKRICGLAHCLLPEAPTRSFEIGGRFVTQAVPSLMALMKIQPDETGEIEVILAGGGNMLDSDGNGRDSKVGSSNAEVALRVLRDAGFCITTQSTGGTEGRHVVIDCSECSFQIKNIPRLEKAV